jgi:hypothetical protein
MKSMPPKEVLIYRQAQNLPVPKCCHTCYDYNDVGVCMKFNQTPPDSFTQELNQCQEWSQEIPF